ncbi:MAG: hypothetical protein KBB71_04815 [Lentimicrobiaceae bacterium]|nr:hypothetical protein [Lentimicrobiaceae bacterium]
MTEERLYLQDLLGELRYRDRRSVRRWCKNNNVRILSDVGSNRQFVLRDEFEKEKNKIYKLRSLISYASKKSLSRNGRNRPEKVMGYKPQGEYEKNFLSIFTNSISPRYDTDDGK